VRGPDVPAGKTRSEFVLNTDIAPTFTDLAGANTPTFVDGRSLKPLLTGTTPPTTWRSSFLLESYANGEQDDDSDNRAASQRSLFGVRTSQYKYVEYDSGDKELYDLSGDPYELDSAYQEADSELADSLKTRLEALKSCAGESCQVAEDGP
jgi:arylsulfatase A-like enzyme